MGVRRFQLLKLGRNVGYVGCKLIGQTGLHELCSGLYRSQCCRSNRVKDFVREVAPSACSVRRKMMCSYSVLYCVSL